MKWFKHDTDAQADAKIKKLIIKHGAEGYAIYFHCLELIAGNIESSMTFELEHDAEIIADNLKIKSTSSMAAVDRVNMIMRDIIDLNLFEESEGRIFCFKLLKRLDSSMTSNPYFRKVIQASKENHDTIMTPSCQNRIDKNRIDKNKEYMRELFDKWWNLYDKKRGKEKTFSLWLKLNPSPELYDIIVKHTAQYVANTDKQYRKDPERYIRHECWHDEVVAKKGKSKLENTSPEALQKLWGIRK